MKETTHCPTCLQVLTVKWQRAADQCVQNDSEAPHVHLRSVVLLALEKFRRSVGRRATECVQLVAQRELIAEAEVCNLDVGVGVQQKVLRLSHKHRVEGAKQGNGKEKKELIGNNEQMK